MYKEPNKSFGQFGRKGKTITPQALEKLLPSRRWLIASNETTDQWNERYDRKYANIYWDEAKKALRGVIYATHRNDSPWSPTDKAIIYFDDYLLKAKDLKDYRSHMGPSFKGKWSSKWKPRWRIFWLRDEEEKGSWKISNATDLDDQIIDVKKGQAKLNDIFVVAKKDPHIFLDPNLVDYGLLNRRFF